jgi:hypothetical protein
MLSHAIKVIFSDKFSDAKEAQIPPFFKGGLGGICPKQLIIHKFFFRNGDFFKIFTNIAAK